jgi:hypothetical protein
MKRLALALPVLLLHFACDRELDRASMLSASDNLCADLANAKNIPASFKTDQIRFMCAKDNRAKLDSYVYSGQKSPQIYAYTPKDTAFHSLERSKITWGEVKKYDDYIYYGTVRVVTGIKFKGTLDKLIHTTSLYCLNYDEYKKSLLASSPADLRAKVNSVFDKIAMVKAIPRSSEKCRAQFLGLSNMGFEAEYVFESFGERLSERTAVGGNFLETEYVDEHLTGTINASKTPRLGKGAPFIRDYSDFWVATENDGEVTAYIFSELTFKSSRGVSYMVENGVIDNLNLSMSGLTYGLWYHLDQAH